MLGLTSPGRSSAATLSGLESRIQLVARFKEKRRIDAAIDHGNKTELEWASSYCAMRLRLARTKHHEKHWRAIEQRVRAAIEKTEQDDVAERT